MENEVKESRKMSETVPTSPFVSVKKGDVVKFGSYMQDADVSEVAKPIEWLVLDIKDGQALLLSKYGLDNKLYNEEWDNITWSECTLHNWLNNNFYQAAFNDGEKEIIAVKTVNADKNPRYDTNPGKNTQDPVFLLSITEAERYFNSDSARRCVPTFYAKKQVIHTYNDYETGGEAACWWWLRSPGLYSSNAAYVNTDGSVNYNGLNVCSDVIVLRPALWVNL